MIEPYYRSKDAKAVCRRSRIQGRAISESPRANEWPMRKCFALGSSTCHWLGGSESAGSWGARKGDLRIAQANVWPMMKCFALGSSTCHWLGGSESAAPWGQGMAISESPRANEGPMGECFCSPHRLTIGSADRSPPLLGDKEWRSPNRQEPMRGRWGSASR